MQPSPQTASAASAHSSSFGTADSVIIFTELGIAPSSIRAYSGSLQPLKYKTVLFILYM